MTEDYFSRILCSVSPSVPRQTNFSQTNCTAARGKARGRRRNWQPACAVLLLLCLLSLECGRPRRLRGAGHERGRPARSGRCFAASRLRGLRSCSEAPALRPARNTLRLSRLSRAFLWRGLTALPARGPGAFIPPPSGDGEAKSPVFR